MLNLKTLKVENWKAALLLSIVVPVGLLTAFKVTGVLREPTTPITVSETITLETVKRELERPSSTISTEERIRSLYDDDLLINQNIFIHHYVEEMQDYGGSDCVSMIINVTATVQEGYLVNAYVAFHEDYQPSQVYMPSPESEPVFYASLENLSIIDSACAFERWWLLENNTKAFIKAAGENSPNAVYLWAPAHWILRSPNNYTHQMQIICEITYFNGSAYKKVVQPYLLKIGLDDNNSFETAHEIFSGITYSKLYLGESDGRDFYRIHVKEGDSLTIQTEASSVAKPNFYLDVYNPEREWKVRSGPEYSHSTSFVANSTGYWFIKTGRHDNHGFYTLTITSTERGE